MDQAGPIAYLAQRDGAHRMSCERGSHLISTSDRGTHNVSRSHRGIREHQICRLARATATARAILRSPFSSSPATKRGNAGDRCCALVHPSAAGLGMVSCR
jgi:hypothetical protein